MIERVGWTEVRTLAAAALACVALACAGPGSSTRTAAAPRHPDVPADAADCAACHGEVTPPVVKAWESSKHGMSLVKCFVCHGSAGADFAAAPAPARCSGCHAAAVAAVTREGATRSCFECHQPHALAAPGKTNPHSM